MSVLKLFLGFLVGLVACAILLALISIRSPILAETDTLATRKVAQSEAVVEEVGEQNGNISDQSDQNNDVSEIDATEPMPVPQADGDTITEPDQNTSSDIPAQAPAQDFADETSDPATAQLPDPVVDPSEGQTDTTGDVAQTPDPEPAAPEPKAPAVVELKTQGNTLKLGAGSSRLPKISDTSSSSRLKLASERDAEPLAPDAANEITAFGQNATQLVDLDAPLVSVILLDIGALGVPQSDLLRQTLPFTFGVDGSRSDASRVSSDYRNAGFEVVSVLSDTAVDAISTPEQGVALVQSALVNMPDALALMDGASAKLQKSKQVFVPILSELAQNGYGVLSYKIGLNTGFKEARKAGLVSGYIFKTIDQSVTDPSEAVRVMDRAVFEAAREGAAIVYAVATKPIVDGILDWSQQPGANTVTFAPVSSAMTKLSR